ncbi:MAG: NADH-quinone oxidoreductase subunit C [Acidimicrobiales bacterium]
MADDTPAAADGAAESPEPEVLHGCPVTASRGQRVIHIPRDRYLAVMKLLLADGYHLCSDLTATDYLTALAARPLPDGVVAERFEVVLNLLDVLGARRLRVRVQVPAADPSLPSAFDLWPGTEAMEREVFDLFGITFRNHPDPSRILMPEDWVGHPLRKDYDIGRIPVQFKGAPEGR